MYLLFLNNIISQILFENFWIKIHTQFNIWCDFLIYKFKEFSKIYLSIWDSNSRLKKITVWYTSPTTPNFLNSILELYTMGNYSSDKYPKIKLILIYIENIFVRFTDFTMTGDLSGSKPKFSKVVVTHAGYFELCLHS